MKNYTFIQGVLLGICLWGAISVGLRYIHYAYNYRIPREIMAPGMVLAPALTPEERETWKKQIEALRKENLIKSDNPTVILIKEWIGTIANVVTIFTPLVSGVLSVVIYRKQQDVLNPNRRRKKKPRRADP
jgi:hypothetical protein